MNINAVLKMRTAMKSQDYFTYWGRYNYIKDHRTAYRFVEKELIGKNSFKSHFHDLNKSVMFLLGFPTEFSHNLHMTLSPHHPAENGFWKNQLKGAYNKIAKAINCKQLELKEIKNSNGKIEGYVTDPLSAIIDYHSAILTKPDKPRDVIDFYLSIYHKHRLPKLEKALKRLGFMNEDGSINKKVQSETNNRIINNWVKKFPEKAGFFKNKNEKGEFIYITPEVK